MPLFEAIVCGSMWRTVAQKHFYLKLIGFIWFTYGKDETVIVKKCNLNLYSYVQVKGLTPVCAAELMSNSLN